MKPSEHILALTYGEVGRYAPTPSDELRANIRVEVRECHCLQLGSVIQGILIQEHPLLTQWY